MSRYMGSWLAFAERIFRTRTPILGSVENGARYRGHTAEMSFSYSTDLCIDGRIKDESRAPVCPRATRSLNPTSALADQTSRIPIMQLSQSLPSLSLFVFALAGACMTKPLALVRIA